MLINRGLQVLMLAAMLVSTAHAAVDEFDHGLWNGLLEKHVQTLPSGKATAVDYQGMLRERQVLNSYLQRLAAVSRQDFDRWSPDQQLAFLINAYNAATVELILTAWPQLTSIKELGSWFRSPWKKIFVELLGERRSLDDIEHNLIRGSGRYKDPRIHFAVNCASISCPDLRTEAYTGNRLEQQLSEQTAVFLQDRSRNQLIGTTLRLSPLFNWYREDFEQGWHDFTRLEDFLLAHAADLQISGAVAQALKRGTADIEFMDYDWRLNKQ